jgi:hypothetical protein
MTAASDTFKGIVSSPILSTAGSQPDRKNDVSPKQDEKSAVDDLWPAPPAEGDADDSGRCPQTK